MQTRSLKGNLLHQPIQIIKRFNFSIVFNLKLGKQFVNLDKSVVHSLFDILYNMNMAATWNGISVWFWDLLDLNISYVA